MRPTENTVEYLASNLPASSCPNYFLIVFFLLFFIIWIPYYGFVAWRLQNLNMLSGDP